MKASAIYVLVGTISALFLLGLFALGFLPPDVEDNGEITFQEKSWETFTNASYGYEVSYPEHLTFVKSSDIAPNPIADGAEDQLVFIFDGRDTVYPLLAGVVVEYKALNLEELEKRYREISIPSHINSKLGRASGATSLDFDIVRTELGNRDAILITSPVGYQAQTFNDQGTVFTIYAQGDFAGATTTSKDRLTLEIIDTFRILE